MWSSRTLRQLSRSNSNTRLGLGLGFFRRGKLSAANGKRFAALWGNGDYGRLGLGGLESQWTPVICSAFNGDSLRAIACGGAHTLFLTESGRVFASGLNDFGQLGISDNKEYATVPVEVTGLIAEIKQISAGYSHSSAVTVDGKLYMWGKNSDGQLGLGKRAQEVVPGPTKVDSLTGINIKMASLGSEHSIAVTAEGVALSWGGGSYGRLGHGHQSSLLGFLKSNRISQESLGVSTFIIQYLAAKPHAGEYTPRLIKALEGIKIKRVAAGLLHTACIDESGGVFIFGERGMYKFGFRNSENAGAPSMMPELPVSEDVACGGYHTCVITSGGELYTWGSNENGCLGIGCTDVIDLPEKVQGPFSKYSVSKVSCGWKHTAAVSNGRVFTWGWGGSHGTFSVDGQSSGGQLGHGTDVDYMEPAMVEFGNNVVAVEVSCGFNHTAAILEYV